MYKQLGFDDDVFYFMIESIKNLVKWITRISLTIMTCHVNRGSCDWSLNDKISPKIESKGFFQPILTAETGFGRQAYGK